MHIVILGVAALFALVLASVVLLLCMFAANSASSDDPNEPTETLWKVYPPIDRLLDPADFQYLRRRHVSEARIKRLRVERRKIFRLCLRSMAREFHSAERAVKLLLVHAGADRPDLAAELARQRFTFYRNMFKAHTWLVLHACGSDYVLSVDLLQPLKTVQAHLQQLMPMPALAGVAG